MVKKVVYLVIVCLSVLSLGTFVLMAQDEAAPPNTLEEIASFPGDYYGSSVTFDGYVSEFLNSLTFVAGENAVFDNDMVLVVTRSGQAFSPTVTKGAQVRITGQVYQSLDVARDAATVEGDDRDVETIMIDGDAVPGLQFYYDGHLLDDYNNFTIIVVETVDAVEVLVGADGDEVAPDDSFTNPDGNMETTPDPIEEPSDDMGEATEEPMDDMGEATEEPTDEMGEPTEEPTEDMGEATEEPTEEMIEPTATPAS